MKKGFRQSSSRVVILAFAALAGALSFHAMADQVYTWTDENGVTHFSDREPPDTDTQVIDMAEKPGGVTYSKPQEASDGEAVAVAVGAVLSMLISIAVEVVLRFPPYSVHSPESDWPAASALSTSFAEQLATPDIPSLF